MAHSTIDHITTAFVTGHPSLTSDDQRMARTIYRLLATGPAPPEAIAEAAGIDVDHVRRRLDEWGAVFRDRQGAVVGFWGFAVEEVTGHRLDLGDLGQGWTWCAYDTFFIAHLLGVTARVTSPCPTTGQTVRLTVSPDGVTDRDPAGAVMSMLTPGGPFDDHVRETLCHYIHLFASPAAADAWTADHPGTYRLPLDDAFEIARRQNRAVYPDLLGAGRSA